MANFTSYKLPNLSDLLKDKSVSKSSVMHTDKKKYLNEIYRLFLFDSRVDKQGNSSQDTYNIYKEYIKSKKDHYLETINILPKSINFTDIFTVFFDVINTHTFINFWDFKKIFGKYNLFTHSIFSHQIAFLLKYIKTENTTKIYDFYILNAGFGVENHENINKIINNIEYVPSIMIIHNVSEISIQTLFSLLVDDTFTIVSMNHFYSIIKYILQCSFTSELNIGRLILELESIHTTEKEYSFLYSSSQNSHNCTFYSYLLTLYCIIHDELKNTQSDQEINKFYEYIKNYLKLKLLNDYLDDKITNNEIECSLLLEVQTINNKLFEILTNENIYEYNKNREKINLNILELYESLDNKIIINRNKLIKRSLTINNHKTESKKNVIKSEIQNQNEIITEIMLIKDKLLDKLNELNMMADNYDEWCEIVSIMIEMIYKTTILIERIYNIQYEFINTNIIYYHIFIKYQNILYFNIFNKFIKFLEENKTKELKISDSFKKFKTKMIREYSGIYPFLSRYSTNTETTKNNISITLNLLFIFSIYIKINNHFNFNNESDNYLLSNDISSILSNIFLTRENNNIHKTICTFYNNYYPYLRFGYVENMLQPKIYDKTEYKNNDSGKTSDITLSTTKHEFDNISFGIFIILCRGLHLNMNIYSHHYDDNNDDNDNYDKVASFNLITNYSVKNSHITDINILNIFNNHINLTENIFVPYIGYSHYNNDPQYINKLYSYSINNFISADTMYNKYKRLFSNIYNIIYLQRYIKMNISDTHILFYIIFYIEIIGKDEFISNIIVDNNNNIYFACLENIIYDDIINIKSFELIYKFLYCIIKNIMVSLSRGEKKINLNDKIIDTYEIYDFIIYIIDKLTHRLIINKYDLPDIDFSLLNFSEIYKEHFSKKIILDIQILINPDKNNKYIDYYDIIIIDYNINTQTILYNNIYYNIYQRTNISHISLIYEKFNLNIFLNENDTNIIRELKYSKNNNYELSNIKYNVIDEPIITYKFNNYPDKVKKILTGYSLIDAQIINIEYKDYISESQIKKYISPNFKIIIDETKNDIYISNIYDIQKYFRVIPLKKIYETMENNEYKIFRIIYDKIFDFMKDYLFYNNLELILSNISEENTILLLVEDISYIFLLEYELIDKDIKIKNFIIHDLKNNIHYLDIDYHLINIQQHLRYYLLDTPNMYCKIDMEDYILYVSQKGLNKIKINKNGLINNLPSENTFLYFLNSIGNNCYYNIYNLFFGAFAYLNTSINELEYLKGKLYQIQQAFHAKSIYLLYYLIKLNVYIKDLYIDNSEIRSNILLINNQNLFFIINNVLPDIYSNVNFNENRYYFKLYPLNDKKSIMNTRLMLSTYKMLKKNDINSETIFGDVTNYKINFDSKFIDDIFTININTYDIPEDNLNVYLNEIYNNLKFPDILNALLYDKSDNF